MVKQVIAQTFYQLVILLTFLFLGPSFLVEPYEKDQNKEEGKLSHLNSIVGSNLVRSGMSKDGYDHLELGPSRHFTYCFNVFVVMNVFNMINSRRINDELNVFSNIWKTFPFFVVFFGIFILQALILSFGGILFNCTLLVCFFVLIP